MMECKAHLTWVVSVKLGNPSSRTSSYASLWSSYSPNTSSSPSSSTDGKSVAAIYSIGGETVEGTRGVTLSLHIFPFYKVIIHSLVLPLIGRETEKGHVIRLQVDFSLGVCLHLTVLFICGRRSVSVNPPLQRIVSMVSWHCLACIERCCERSCYRCWWQTDGWEEVDESSLMWRQSSITLYFEIITLRCVTKLDVTLRFAWILVPHALQLDSILPFSPSNTILK